MTIERGINEINPVQPDSIVSVQQYAYEIKYQWQDFSSIEFFSSPNLSDEYRTLLGIVDIEFHVPAKYNRTTIQILALKSIKKQKEEAHRAQIAELDETIQNLSALSYDQPKED